MRFLFLFFIAASLSSVICAQNTDTTRVAVDSISKVLIPVSIQVVDTIAKKSNIPVVNSDSLSVDTVKPIIPTDTIGIKVSIPELKKDSVAAPAGKSSVGKSAADSATVINSNSAVVAPNEPLNPNYIYSTQNIGIALAKKNIKEKTDTIVMLNGDKILANVKKFTFKDLFYGFPGDVRMVSVDRRYVQKIVYKYGRVETITAREVEVREVGGWKDVKVLKKRTAALDEMVELGEVEGVDEGTREKYVDARDLERSATITIQKKAALLGATIVVITIRDVRRPYGDPPYVRLVAKAYKPK